jgi:hypothetical protein
MTENDPDQEQSNLPLVVDPRREQLSVLNFPEASLDIGAAHAIELLGRAKGSMGVVPGLVGGADACAYLETLIPMVTEQILANQNAYSSVRWLWYLRRLPADFFGGDYRTTIGYDRGLAESLSWFSTGLEASHQDGYVGFRIDNSVIRHLGRYVAAVKVMSHLQIAYRRVGKGALLDTRGAVPMAETPAKIDEAIRTYDLRHDDPSGSKLQGLGLSDVENDTRIMSEELEHLTGQEIYLVMHSSLNVVPAYGPDESGARRPLRVEAYHALGKIPLNSILRPFGSETPYSLPFVSSAEPLMLLLLMFPIFAVYIPWVLIGTLQVGYFFTRQSVLCSIVDQWLPRFRDALLSLAPDIDWSASYAQWRARLDAIAPGTWPLQAGGVIRPYMKDHILVDLCAASSALIARVKSDRTAADLANSRSQTFELQVQALIDSSEWRPDSALAALRGRTLRHSGSVLTDIDAIGARGSTLLLVSCKSLIYDGDYDKGTYKVIRNAQSTVDAAVKDWRSVVEWLRSNPVGDNFDFTGFTHMVGPICTPFVVYSDSSETLAFADTALRVCVSAAELSTWLGRAI